MVHLQNWFFCWWEKQIVQFIELKKIIDCWTDCRLSSVCFWSSSRWPLLNVVFLNRSFWQLLIYVWIMVSVTEPIRVNTQFQMNGSLSKVNRQQLLHFHAVFGIKDKKWALTCRRLSTFSSSYRRWCVFLAGSLMYVCVYAFFTGRRRRRRTRRRRRRRKIFTFGRSRWVWKLFGQSWQMSRASAISARIGFSGSGGP